MNEELTQTVAENLTRLEHEFQQRLTNLQAATGYILPEATRARIVEIFHEFSISVQNSIKEKADHAIPERDTGGPLSGRE